MASNVQNKGPIQALVLKCTQDMIEKVKTIRYLREEITEKDEKISEMAEILIDKDLEKRFPPPKTENTVFTKDFEESNEAEGNLNSTGNIFESLCTVCWKAI